MNYLNYQYKPQRALVIWCSARVTQKKEKESTCNKYHTQSGNYMLAIKYVLSIL